MGIYNPQNLFPALRLFIDARNVAVDGGFTDNGGAIHSVARILDILCANLCYPHLNHINNYKSDPGAEISLAAHQARVRCEPVFIEHVMPQRAWAREIIRLVGDGCSDQDIISYIRTNYRLVLLTAGETKLINKLNRSDMTPDRIADAGIKLWPGT